MKRLKWGAVALTLALAVSACGGNTGGTGGAAPTPDGPVPVAQDVVVKSDSAQALQRGEVKPGGTLRVGMLAAPESLDPGGVVSLQASLMHLIYDSLFVYDELGNVTPELAESIETTDGGTTWIMKLPTGVKFHDGTDFNSAAVVAHLNRVGREGSLSRSATDVRQIASMETPDDTTVRFVLKSSNMTFPKIFVTAVVLAAGMVPSPTAVEKYGDQFGLHPVGVGPFKVKQFSAGGDVVLERNENYRVPGQPLLDGLTFVVAADTQSRLQAAIAGDLDIGSTQNGRDLAAATDAGLTSLYQPDGTFFNIILNMEKPPFNDPNFRKAVAHGIDNQALVDAVFDGKATPMSGYFPTSNPYYNAEAGYPAYDLEAAKRLVEEYKAKGGNPEFTFVSNPPPEYQRIAQLVQQMLQEAGMTVHIRIIDQPTTITEALSGNYQAQLRFTEVRAEVDMNMRTLYYGTSRGNVGRGNDPRMDQILDELTTPEGQERKEELYAEMQTVMANWVPHIPLVAHRNGWYVGKNVAAFPGNRPGIGNPDWRLVAHS
ncbi:ABC transporter substrate-binding protein [Ammonicoccus fulvus]|uniref:ABC transporter substrate-binding protein n=1 Tax=Ammonicoccus fulvus TaxID=3138240 RepID=A0ABZ3FME2_9ACTN